MVAAVSAARLSNSTVVTPGCKPSITFRVIAVCEKTHNSRLNHTTLKSSCIMCWLITIHTLFNSIILWRLTLARHHQQQLRKKNSSQIRQKSGLGSSTIYEGVTTALPSKHSNACNVATEVQEEQITRGRDLKKEMCSAGYKYSWRKMRVAAKSRPWWIEKWFADHVSSLTATRLNG